MVRSAQDGRLPVTITDHDEPIAGVRPQYLRRVVSLAEFQAAEISDQAVIGAVAARFAVRLKTDAGPDRAAQVRRAWQLTFQRPPAATQQTEALAFVEQQLAHLASLPPPPAGDKAKRDEKAKAEPKPTPER